MATFFVSILMKKGIKDPSAISLAIFLGFFLDFFIMIRLLSN